jgi:hypothetical protein
MGKTMSTFGEDLLHYAETAHSISQQDYVRALDHVKKHLESTLDAVFFAVVVQKNVNFQPHLVSEYPGGDQIWWIDLIKDEKGQYKGQTALSYSIGKAVWIIGPEKQDLSSTNSYRDLLANARPEEIPRYARIPQVTQSKTSIILPLFRGSHVFGVMNVESKVYLRVSNITFHELDRIARAIGVLRHTKESTELIDRRTNAAWQRLEKGNFSPVFGNLQLFLASSGRATNDVMGEVKNTLAKFEAHFDHFDWTEPGAGDIKTIIWKNISRSRFAICYLSEPAAAGPPKYQDNPNVLIECGMLYALRESRQSSQNFVIIREPDSPPSPFDINSEYMLIVPRSHDGTLNREGLRDKLDVHIRSLLRSVEPEVLFGGNL